MSCFRRIGNLSFIGSSSCAYSTSYVAGVAAWLLYDFRTERRQTGFQRGWNRKGLIAEDKATKQPAFYGLAALFDDRSAILLLPQDEARQPHANLERQRKGMDAAGLHRLA